LPLELLNEIFAYYLASWTSVDRTGYIESLAEYDVLRDLARLVAVNVTWNSVIKTEMTRAMDSWDDVLFIAILQGAAQKGALWVVRLAFESRRAGLLSIPFDSRTRSSLLPMHNPEPFPVLNDALCSAAVQGRCWDVAFFSGKVSDIDAPASMRQETALNLAIAGGNLNASRLLLAQGANPDSQRSRDKQTPLHATTNMKCSLNSDIALMLLKNGAQTGLWDNNLAKPIHHAAMNGQTAILDLLLRYGANIDDKLASSRSQTPLMFASASSEALAVKLLLRKGAMVNLVINGFGYTALGLAVRDTTYHITRPRPSRSCAQEIIDALLDYGADITIVPTFTRYSPSLIHSWLRVPSNAQWDDNHLCSVILKCLEKGVDPNICNEYGRTALEEIFFARTKDQIMSIPLTIVALLRGGANDNMLVAICARADLKSKGPLLRYALKIRNVEVGPDECPEQIMFDFASSRNERRAGLYMLLNDS
ncbi:MAG: hypothetical protein Q9217_001800, partial [Psora testacea]